MKPRTIAALKLAGIVALKGAALTVSGAIGARIAERYEGCRECGLLAGVGVGFAAVKFVEGWACLSMLAPPDAQSEARTQPVLPPQTGGAADPRTNSGNNVPGPGLDGQINGPVYRGTPR